MNCPNVKASEVSGVSVKNMADENLGEINDVVIDKLSGKVSYVVLDFGGFMGIGNKFFPVPWNAITYDKKEDCFLLDVDKERLKNAPGFDKDHWPEFDTSFTTEVDRFYH